MPEQLGFDLPGITALERADFLVAPSNAVAVALIEAWQDWSPRKLVVCGPEGSGKTHLTHVWANMCGARILPAKSLAEVDVPEVSRGDVAVEDVSDIANDPVTQTALFHLHNLVLAEGNALLMTGVGEPKHWGLTLPDLASRVEGTQTAVMHSPDDALLAAVIAKLLADRQLTPRPDLIPYLVSRIDRSFAAARDIVARLDAASLALKRPVTRALAAALLDNRQNNAR